MNNKSYIRALRHKLRPLDRKSRNEILEEIEASIADVPEEKLEDRFGPVDQLAAQYLEDMPERHRAATVFGKALKWGFVAVGAVTIVLVGIIAWYANKPDDFDYADPMAPELEEMTWETWANVPEHIYIYQTNAVLYAGAYDELSYSCVRQSDDTLYHDAEKGRLVIKRNKCFFRLPEGVRVIDADQSSIVLNGLNGEKTISLDQTALRLAQEKPISIAKELNDCKYQVSKRLSSGGLPLALKGEQCSVTEYGK